MDINGDILNKVFIFLIQGYFVMFGWYEVFVNPVWHLHFNNRMMNILGFPWNPDMKNVSITLKDMLCL